MVNKVRLNENFTINPRYTPVFRGSTFISQVFFWCDIKKKVLISVNKLQLFGVNGIKFNRTEHLDEESFNTVTNLYFDYVLNKFSNDLTLFTLDKTSKNTFMLHWDSNLIGGLNPIQNYITYLSLMMVVPTLKPHTDNLNCGLNPLNLSLDYEVFIDELSLGKDMYIGGFYINATDTKKRTEVPDLPGRQYVVIYQSNNSEYFLKIGYLFKLGNFDSENFEKQLNNVHSMLWCLIFEDRDELHISIDGLSVDIYVMVNISKAGEEDWEFLCDIPRWF